MKKSIFFTLVCLSCLLLSVFVMSLQAQVKIGSNPTTITVNTNLETEATDGTHTRINKDNGNVGIGTTAAPTNKLHVNGTNPLRLEGVQNSTDNADHPLVVDATGVVKAAATVKGLLNQVYNLIGTTSQSIAVGTEVNVNGLSQTFTTTDASLVQITVTGYTELVSSNGTGQGVFSIYIDNVRMTSAFASSYTGSLVRMPVPCTQTYLASLATGTHTIRISFKNWAVAGATGGTNLVINTDAVASGYVGASGVDADAMKSRLSIAIYNN